MIALLADTHVAIWYFVGSHRLSQTARVAIDDALRAGNSVAIATISLVEVEYLIGKGRIPSGTFDALEKEVTNPTRGFVLQDLDLRVARALRLVPRDLIPDMPDRIIAATAKSLTCPLVTADGLIRASGVVATVW